VNWTDRKPKTQPVPANIAARNYEAPPTPRESPPFLELGGAGYLDLAREVLKSRTPVGTVMPAVGTDTYALVSIAASLAELVELQRKSR
jgi:hypothetical protein